MSVCGRPDTAAILLPSPMALPPLRNGGRRIPEASANDGCTRGRPRRHGSVRPSPETCAGNQVQRPAVEWCPPDRRTTSLRGSEGDTQLTPKRGEPRRRTCEPRQAEQHGSQAVLQGKPPWAPIVHLLQAFRTDNPALVERSKEKDHVLRSRNDAPVRPVRRTEPSPRDVDFAVEDVGRLIERPRHAALVADQPRVLETQRVKNAGFKDEMKRVPGHRLDHFAQEQEIGVRIGRSRPRREIWFKLVARTPDRLVDGP